jgi:hypothetical protein
MMQAMAMTRRGILGLGLGALAAPRMAQAQAASATVVELFTSQGCSSCPPADQLLARLCAEKNLIALTYNVDYWDYLGWQDSLARPEFSERQKAYAKARGDADVYTPQLVINGLVHVPGNDETMVRAAIATAQTQSLPVSLSLAREQDALVIEAGPGAQVKGASLVLVPFAEEVSVTISRGENNGQAITYHHVAKRLIPAGLWQGKPVRLALPAGDVMGEKPCDCVALLQAETGGAILGAARLNAAL